MKRLTMGCMLILWTAAFVMGCNSDGETTCELDRDCADDEACQQGVCVKVDPANDGDTDGDTSNPPHVDGDSNSHATDGDTADGDMADGDSDANAGCQCSYDNYQFCDESADTCRSLQCQSCYVDSDCSDGERCLNIKFEDSAQSEFLICTRTGCQDDSGCPLGFFCNQYVCYPKALCKVDGGNASLDQPCPFGVVNVDGVTCREQTQCIGMEPNAQLTCTTDQDCANQQSLPGADCVEGSCGYSSCMERCNEQGACDDQHDPMAVGDSCYCVLNTGGAGFGEVCSSEGVHADAGPCAQDLSCIVTSENAQATCTTAADCGSGAVTPPWNNAVADCTNGLCRFSVCVYACENNQCPNGGSPQDVGGQCACMP